MRKVPGFPGYLVTPDGVVWSIREGQPRKLITSMHKGYVHAQIKSAPGRHNQRKMPVHQVVLLAFVGPVPAGQEVRHKDGDPSNCCLGTLEYGTRSQNIGDAKLALFDFEFIGFD